MEINRTSTSVMVSSAGQCATSNTNTSRPKAGYDSSDRRVADARCEKEHHGRDIWQSRSKVNAMRTATADLDQVEASPSPEKPTRLTVERIDAAALAGPSKQQASTFPSSYGDAVVGSMATFGVICAAPVFLIQALFQPIESWAGERRDWFPEDRAMDGASVVSLVASCLCYYAAAPLLLCGSIVGIAVGSVIGLIPRARQPLEEAGDWASRVLARFR